MLLCTGREEQKLNNNKRCSIFYLVLRERPSDNTHLRNLIYESYLMKWNTHKNHIYP